MFRQNYECFEWIVALRKESVDRNFVSAFDVLAISASLSARRAWIEILCAAILSALACVALRKESVDRNNGVPYSAAIRLGRSPQGERG